MSDNYEYIHHATDSRIAEMLEPIGLDLGASGDLEACAIIGEAVRRLRIPPHLTFHEEYMGGVDMNPFATYIKPVDVLTDNGWITFDSVKDAEEYLGVATGTLSAKLIRDLPCKGYQVRYHQNDEP